MAKLPFVVAPRLAPVTETIGTEESGKIEIKRQGYLTAAEKTFAQSQSVEEESTRRMLAFSRVIGAELKLDLQKSYELIGEVLQGISTTKNHEKIREKHEKEIDELITQMTNDAYRRRLVTALCMLVYRVDSTFGAEDVMQLHPDLIEALADLYDDEESKSTTRLAQAMGDEPLTSAEQIDKFEKK